MGGNALAVCCGVGEWLVGGSPPPPTPPPSPPPPSYNKLKQKHDDDIHIYEDLAGEVRFSSHLPQPNNLNGYTHTPAPAQQPQQLHTHTCPSPITLAGTHTHTHTLPSHSKHHSCDVIVLSSLKSIHTGNPVQIPFKNNKCSGMHIH